MQCFFISTSFSSKILFLYFFSLLLLFSVNLYEMSEVGLFLRGSYYTSMCGFPEVFLFLQCGCSWAEAVVYQECSLECATGGNSSFHKPRSSFFDN